MTSKTTERFRKAFRQLPLHVQEQAKEAYRQFKLDPHHPSLHFKQIHPKRPIFSARIGIGYRALGVKEDNVMVWFWIGSHADYDRLINQR